MAVFFDTVGKGDTFNSPHISWPVAHTDWVHPGSGSGRTVIVAMTYQVDGGVLTSLEREATYDGLQMTSLGVEPWGGGYAWTELFGIIDVPAGKKVHAQVSGYLFAGRALKATSVSFTGVDRFDVVVHTSGTGTSLLHAATADPADMLVQAFGTMSGLSAYGGGDQRFINNTAISLAVGDYAGTGSPVNFVATRAKSGGWSGLSVVLNAADVIVTAEPLVSAPAMRGSVKRLPRPGIKRRTVFDMKPEL